jgi:type IV pilus assembly protein PilW
VIRRIHPSAGSHRHASGFSLVELMVAMVISLLLGAAAVSVFLSNKRIYSATEGLGRIQESARIAFELMSRDIRGAGGNPCDVRMELVNVLNDATNWWASYDAGISGFDDGDHPDSAGETDAIRIQYFEDTGVVTSGGMANVTAALPVSNTTPFREGQILMACGFFPIGPTEPVIDTAAIFSAGLAGNTITHSVGDGNISDDFSNALQPTAVSFPAGSSLGVMRALEWYVATNDDGGTSLYRRQLLYADSGPEMGAPEEIVPDVTDMQLSYLENGSWVDGNPAGMPNATAVRVTLILQARDSRAGGVDGNLISRRLENVIALRNKL